jgi:hypothetical protein
MEISEKLFEIMYQIVISQNKRLLQEIAIREKIPAQDMYDTFLQNRSHFRNFMKSYSSSSSS